MKDPGQILICIAIIVICAESPKTPTRLAALIMTIFALLLTVGVNLLGR